MPTVLVTGANRGLGLEFARQYAADGWRVLATARRPGSFPDGLRGVEQHLLDVTDRSSIERLARALEGEAIDLFIANAGVMPAGPSARPEEIPDEGWAEAFRVNAVAPLLCARAFVEHVARSAQRKMAVMSSWIGSIGSNTVGGHYVYRASKAALNAAWRSFALDHPQLIAVALSPGALRTDMTRYDRERWERLPDPAENIARLRALLAGAGPQDSGTLIHFDGRRLPW